MIVMNTVSVGEGAVVCEETTAVCVMVLVVEVRVSDLC